MRVFRRNNKLLWLIGFIFIKFYIFEGEAEIWPAGVSNGTHVPLSSWSWKNRQEKWWITDYERDNNNIDAHLHTYKLILSSSQLQSGGTARVCVCDIFNYHLLAVRLSITVLLTQCEENQEWSDNQQLASHSPVIIIVIKIKLCEDRIISSPLLWKCLSKNVVSIFSTRIDVVHTFFFYYFDDMYG